MKAKLCNQTLALVACLALALPGLAQEKSKDKGRPITREDHILLSITGTVEAVDHAKRELTLKGPLGRMETFSVDPVVKRFNEVKAGDAITVDYYIGIAAELRKPTPEEEKEPLVVLEGAAKAGAKEAPAGAGMRRIKAVVTIEGLDRPTQTVTVKGPIGRYFTTRVADPSRLEQMRIGETAVVTFTEAAVVSLEKAKGHEKK